MKKRINKLKNPTGVFLLLVLLAFALMMIGMFTPPEGMISPTVLIGAGQFLVLAATVMGYSMDINIDTLKGILKVDTDSEDDK